MITLQNISLQRGPNLLLDKASATILPQHRAAIIGSNGCGKSSFFKLLLGELSLDGGDISIPQHWRVAHMAQEVADSQRTALDYVLDGDTHLRRVEASIAKANDTEDHDLLVHAYAELEQIDGYTAESRAGQLLYGLGFKSNDLTKSVTDFSGGWRIRLNLAQALMCPSDLLLLDEPTNHLDMDATLWLEQWLKSYQGTLLLISHDRDFIDGVAGQILHFEQQTIKSYTGNYSSFEIQRAQALAQQQANYEKQQQRIGEITQFVNRFKAKASKARQAQSRLKELERMEKIAPAHIDSPFSFRFSEADKTSDPLLTLEKVEIGYLKDKPVLSNVNLSLRSDTRIGLLGYNGAGKSTLVKTLVGDLNILNGERAESEHLNIGYFAQHQLEFLDIEASAVLHIQRLAEANGQRDATEQVIRNFLGSFNFHGDKATAPIKPFSGGEKARLALALIVWQKPNLLVLDEPTNHLDLEMRHALTVALQSYKGALVIISHDRHLLKNTVDEFYLVANQTVQAFDGDLQDYQKWLRESLQEASASDKQKKKSRNQKEKKAPRQQNAEQREAIKSLKQQMQKTEKQLEKHQKKLALIQEQLGDESIYHDDNKKQLQDYLKEQGETTAIISTLEEEWLVIQEQLDRF